MTTETREIDLTFEKWDIGIELPDLAFNKENPDDPVYRAWLRSDATFQSPDEWSHAYIEFNITKDGNIESDEYILSQRVSFFLDELMEEVKKKCEKSGRKGGFFFNDRWFFPFGGPFEHKEYEIKELWNDIRGHVIKKFIGEFFSL